MAESRIKELLQLQKQGKLSPEEKAELLQLMKKTKGNRRLRRERGPRTRSESTDFQPGNDFAWWNKVPELLADAANYKSNYIAGTAIAGTDVPFVIPGVVTVHLDSVYGNNFTATDAINVWARDLYLRMFQKYRPATGYTASDLGIAIIASLEIIKLIAKYERVYGIVNRYSVLNVNMPFVEAQGLGLSVADVTYLQSHMSDFRYDLNFLIRKAQRLCIPKDLSAIADAISLFGYEYLDHENARGQIILFDIDRIGVYDETSISSGGAVKFEELTSSYAFFDFTADNMCLALDAALQALIGSDSIQRIFADLVVWFGQEAMLQILTIPDSYVIGPVFSESILHKLHNLEMSNNPSRQLRSWADPSVAANDVSTVCTDHWVYQVDDRIVTKCGLINVTGTGTNTQATVDGGTMLMNNYTSVNLSTSVCHVLDAYRSDITPELITEGVLFKFHGRLINDATAGYITMIDSCGFYIVSDIELFTNGNATGQQLVTCNTTSAYATSTAGYLAILDWAPLSYYSTYSGGIFTPLEIYGDMDLVVPMYGNGLSRIQRTILLSGLQTNVQTVGSAK